LPGAKERAFHSGEKLLLFEKAQLSQKEELKVQIQEKLNQQQT